MKKIGTEFTSYNSQLALSERLSDSGFQTFLAFEFFYIQLKSYGETWYIKQLQTKFLGEKQRPATALCTLTAPHPPPPTPDPQLTLPVQPWDMPTEPRTMGTQFENCGCCSNMVKTTNSSPTIYKVKPKEDLYLSNTWREHRPAFSWNINIFKNI